MKRNLLMKHTKTWTTALASTVVLLFQIALISAPSASATTNDCGSNWCSGSDSNTGVNVQGNAPQIYLGQVGVYSLQGTAITPSACPSTGSFVSPGQGCWNSAGANSALKRTTTLTPTGLGLAYSWFAGGPNAKLAQNYPSPYCWGWEQGIWAEDDVLSLPTATWRNATVMFMDIEGGTTWGWAPSSQSGGSAQDQQVINGFQDEVALRSSAEPSKCNYGGPDLLLQYGIYSSPSQWALMFGAVSGGSLGGYVKTLMWTNENDEATWMSPTDPTSFSNNNVHEQPNWFGMSSFNCGYQYFSGASDFDLFYEPVQLPVYSDYNGFITYWGT